MKFKFLGSVSDDEKQMLANLANSSTTLMVKPTICAVCGKLINIKEYGIHQPEYHYMVSTLKSGSFVVVTIPIDECSNQFKDLKSLNYDSITFIFKKTICMHHLTPYGLELIQNISRCHSRMNSLLRIEATKANAAELFGGNLDLESHFNLFYSVVATSLTKRLDNDMIKNIIDFAKRCIKRKNQKGENDGVS